MARKFSHPELVRKNISLDKNVHKEGARRARAEGIKGGFSEYIARLIVADMKRKRTVAHSNGYLIPGAAK